MILVPGAGIEPARGQASRDFKSLASTNSATQACGKFLILERTYVKVILLTSSALLFTGHAPFSLPREINLVEMIWD